MAVLVTELIRRARPGTQIAVAGRVDVELRVHGVDAALRRNNDRVDTAVARDDVDHRGVEQEVRAGLAHHVIVDALEHFNADAQSQLGDAYTVEYLAADASGHEVNAVTELHERRDKRSGSAAAEEALRLEDEDLCALTRGGDSGSDPGGTSAYDADVHVIACLEGFCVGIGHGILPPDCDELCLL